MYGALDISTSGMVAQRTRLEVISANIASKDAWEAGPDGTSQPYRRRFPLFTPGDPSAPSAKGRAMGVHVSEVQQDAAPFELAHQPSHPHAYQDGPLKGYVPKSNINSVTEQINAIEAMRAYEANVAAAEATKAMGVQALRLIA